ncbi:MAG: phosphotransferase family protein [Pseudolabrys sp.]
MTAEALPAAAEAAYLTAALRRCGALTDGSVREVAIESQNDTILSRIIRLRLTYDGAHGGAPPSIFLKTNRADRAGLWTQMNQEVTFYSQLAPLMPAGYVPRCFDADWNAESKAWHLLLEDLTDTHTSATRWPLPPTFEQCEQVVGALARIHAAWWDDPRLGTSVGAWTDAAGMERYLKTFGERFARFVEEFGDRLPEERRDIYRRLFDSAPRLSERYNTHRNMTIMHGDAHFWNCLCPKDGGADVRFFDWDCWRVDTGSDDLAYMIAMHWYPDRRRRFERRLLDHYHAELVAHGVRGYERRDLDDDYRLSVLWQIMTPVNQFAIKIPPVIWWNNLERVFLAVDDLGCRDLLGR